MSKGYTTDAAGAAADCRNRGWSPIPLKLRSKEPKLEKLRPFLSRKATDEEFRAFDFQNVGIVTGKVSGFIVLDDDDHGQTLQKNGWNVPPGPTVKTHRGHQHYFRCPVEGFPTFDVVAGTLEVRANGSYVVAPPSVHPEGTVYQWLISPDDADLPDPPEWLIEQARLHGRKMTADDVGEAIADGSRNKTLFSLGCSLRRRGLDEAGIRAALLGLNAEKCQPPLEKPEVLKIAHSAARYEPAEDLEGGANDTGTNSHSTSDRAPTDDELRDRLTQNYPNYGYGLGEWREYKDGIWEAIDDLAVKDRVCQVLEDAKDEKIRPTRNLMSSVTELTRVRVAVPDRLWDADPDVLVCANGTLDLRTRELRQHAKEHYATAAVPYFYNKDAQSVSWQLVMRQVVADNLGKEAVGFLQEFTGYALTTATEHEIAIWLTGKHGGGRSTILEGMRAMLGPRAGVLSLHDIARSTFALTNLPGKSLVTASEQPGIYLRGGGVVNNIISGEPIEVDRKYKDPITIVPRCKIAWAMNELPRVGNMDDGIFRRVKILEVPEIPQHRRDPRVKEDVKRSGAAILNWALDGLDRLRERGRFEIPETITTATDEFREHNDVPGRFVEESCVTGNDPKTGEPYWESSSALYEIYKEWCLDTGHKPQSSTSIADDWKRLGFEHKRHSQGVRWYGVKLASVGATDYRRHSA